LGQALICVLIHFCDPALKHLIRLFDFRLSIWEEGFSYRLSRFRLQLYTFICRISTELFEGDEMLPKTAEYALRTVVCLANESNLLESAEELAEQTKVPRRYLHKVLQDLVSAGLVLSRSGPGGGYRLSLSSDKITILDVVNAVAPLERIRRCPLGLSSHKSLCPLHEELDRAYAATEKAFSRVTIGQLSRSTSELVPLCDVSCD
jgi:Rrf2 family protein